MSKLVTLIAVLMLAVPAAASAQASRFPVQPSPDASAPAVTQDYRSPDARPVAAGVFAQDLRSPDAVPSGRFQAAPVASAPHTSGSFDWAYLAILATIPLLLIGGYFVTLRRGRDSVAVGS
jgi:hypothetical protein